MRGGEKGLFVISRRCLVGATVEALVLRHMGIRLSVLTDWHDLGQAKSFIQSVSWQMAMKKMGVVCMAELRFWEKEG